METIMRGLRWLKLAREVQGADPGAEKDGAKRGGKVLIFGVAAALIEAGGQALLNFVDTQSGGGCVLGPTTCAVLHEPSVRIAIVGALTTGIASLEAWANRKKGIGLTFLDTTKVPAAPAAPPEAPPQ